MWERVLAPDQFSGRVPACKRGEMGTRNFKQNFSPSVM